MDISKDDVFEVLSNPRRIFIFKVLSQVPNVSIRNLAKQVVTLERNKSIKEVTRTEIESVYISLY